MIDKAEVSPVTVPKFRQTSLADTTCKWIIDIQYGKAVLALHYMSLSIRDRCAQKFEVGVICDIWAWLTYFNQMTWIQQEKGFTLFYFSGESTFFMWVATVSLNHNKI